jgi:hypothetical protein
MIKLKNLPLNKTLYDKVKKKADIKFLAKTSIYKSSWIVKEYKKLGGKYSGEKSKKHGLLRWYKEEWIDLNRPIKKNGKTIGYKKCGRYSTKNNLYPLCRPLKRISKDTPKTLNELSKNTISKAKKIKNKLKENGKVKF